MYGKLVDYMGQQQVAVVPGGGIDAVLAHQARPSESHEPPQFLEALRLVVGVVVVDVRTRLFDQQTGELQQRNAHAIRPGKRIVRIRID